MRKARMTPPYCLSTSSQSSTGWETACIAVACRREVCLLLASLTSRGRSWVRGPQASASTGFAG